MSDPTRKWMRRGAALGLAMALGLAPVLAFGDDDDDDIDDHDWAREALRRGEIAPLEAVLEAARARVDGVLVGLELEHEDGVWVYELKLLTDDGRLMEVEVDARSATVLEVEDEDD